MRRGGIQLFTFQLFTFYFSLFTFTFQLFNFSLSTFHFLLFTFTFHFLLSPDGGASVGGGADDGVLAYIVDIEVAYLHA